MWLYHIQWQVDYCSFSADSCCLHPVLWTREIRCCSLALKICVNVQEQLLAMKWNVWIKIINLFCAWKSPSRCAAEANIIARDSWVVQSTLFWLWVGWGEGLPSIILRKWINDCNLLWTSYHYRTDNSVTHHIIHYKCKFAICNYY